MTGFAGIVGRSSETTQATVHDRLIEGIRYRGPDGLTQWQGINAFLVHAHLASIPAPTHTLGSPEKTLKCVGDIRLDNRAEVAALCGVTSPNLPTDVDLVLSAYDKFGPDCCTHFTGDFAFAIWDSEKGQLFCARDPFGVRPFFYHASADGFSFASDEAALGAISTNPGDDEFVAELLAGIVAYGPKTRHPGIYRLLGGHRLLWSAEGIKISRYWELMPDRAPCVDPAERFKVLFSQAVADRLYGTDTVATFLSGGLDSSSISVVVSDMRQQAGLPAPDTFSFVYPAGSVMDETPYIDAVLKAGHFTPHKVLMEDHAPLDDVKDIIEDQKGPIIAAGMAKSRKLYSIAAEAGNKVVLDGHGGDEVVGYGSLRVIEMARAGQWLRMLPLIHTHSKLIADNSFVTWLELFKAYGPRTKPARIIRKLGNRLVAKLYPAPSVQGPAWRQVLSEDFCNRTDLMTRYKRLASMPPDARDDELTFNRWPVLSQMMQSSFEVLDKASAVAGVEARYPFFDTRLAAFCMGLPAEEKLRFGQTRSILRRALKGLLPDKVRLRQTKTSFHPEIVTGLRVHHADLFNEMKRDPHNILEPYINTTALHALIDRLKNPELDFHGGDAMFLWRLCSFYIWRRAISVPER